jgi:hypothetical protein
MKVFWGSEDKRMIKTYFLLFILGLGFLTTHFGHIYKKTHTFTFGAWSFLLGPHSVYT